MKYISRVSKPSTVFFAAAFSYISKNDGLCEIFVDGI